ncbi:hypothetical protein QBC47DRAFT_189285 [Echria macrotheca]|uniref:Uncharacterized protein n=1 Tax=Echria macrotheca TaxID=438768 RepID=A0AAJ0FBR6_9PEZI|nr:hypothetical protein QBC47DRAFT_189285 [Echria macrotheca]
MAMWPFRRKSRRKMRASTSDFDDARGRGAGKSLAPRSQTLQDVTAAKMAPERGSSIRKPHPEPNKLQRKQRTYSFSPGRHDSVRVGRRTSTKSKRKTPIPDVGHPVLGLRRSTRDYDPLNKEMGASWPDVFGAVPTLHNKREGDHLPRKMSSKKRRKDNQREAEIRAMSNFTPLRAATEEWTTGPILRKNSRRTRTGFGVGFVGSSRQEWERYNRSSDISLPADSIHSTHSSDSEHISFKISALESLAPRPTLRVASHPRHSEGMEGEARLARAFSRQQRKLSEPIPEATLKAHKRIHDLADELSASDLRELMERDNRRRERKRQRDQEKLEQRLARRAEKQKAAEVEAKKEGRDSPANLERGVLGREVVGLGLDPTSAVVTSSKIRRSDESLQQKGKQPEGDEGPASDFEPRPHPLQAFHRTDSIPLQSPELPQSRNEPKPEPAPVLTSPRSRSSFIRLKLARSKSPEEADLKTEPSEPTHKGSETSSSKAPLSWGSFFRWGHRNKRNSGGPSSFSNTSRDSVQPVQPVQQQPTAPVGFVPRRLSSGVPKRTMSRFREDLPELPMSPPDSRIQSPEADPIPDTIAEASPDPDAVTEHVVFAPAGPADTFHTPTSEQRSMEAMRQTPSTFGHPDEPPSISPELQTMSLASIDSEASWLSGRLSKKRKPSGNLQPTPYGQRLRRTSDSDTEQQEGDNQGEEMSITEDDYLARVAHSSPERRGWNRKSTGDPRPSSDGEEETHWGSVKGHQPLVVHSHTAGRIKSREGLLKAFGEEGEIDVVVSGEHDNDSGEDEGEGLQRATSVNLGQGHARHISAGSARLLSISPRSSVDTKRLSLPRSQEKTEDS